VTPSRTGLGAALALMGTAALALPRTAAPAPTASPTPADCAGPLNASDVTPRGGPALRFGITPGVVAGQVGPAQPAKPEDPARSLAALQQLRRPGAPFVLRLNRFFWSDGEGGIDHFVALAQQYTAAGFQVELQLRYQPPAGHSDDIAGWTAWVREVVDRLGPNRGVVGLQVTNEVNFTVSPDSSDGANAGAKDALIQGVIAAKDEARRRGYGQLRIGFNWVYRSTPSDDQSFWTYLAQHGGAAFRAALDWVGLDAYPGTLYPPAEATGGYRDGMVNALGVLRGCYMPMAGIAASVPIYIEENGYPTGSGRSEATQLEAQREMVGAVSDFRGTYNVSDYRWFNLRDADSSSSNFQQHYGLLHDDYSPKPAFAAYRQLVGALGLGPGASAPAASRAPTAPRGSARGLRLRLVLAGRRGVRCVRLPATVRLVGGDRARVTRARARLGRARLHHLRRRRLAWRVSTRRLRPGHRGTVTVTVATGPRAGARLTLRLRACSAPTR
jgi:hypothetical protein